MKRTKHTDEQIVVKLREVEAHVSKGETMAEAAKKVGVVEQTVYRWKRQYQGVQTAELKRLRELEKENTRLKRLVVEQALDIAILKEVAEGKF